MGDTLIASFSKFSNITRKATQNLSPIPHSHGKVSLTLTEETFGIRQGLFRPKFNPTQLNSTQPNSKLNRIKLMYQKFKQNGKPLEFLIFPIVQVQC
jgi:hypothetical protein